MTAHTDGSEAGQAAQLKEALRRRASERRAGRDGTVDDEARTARLLGLLEADGLAEPGRVVSCYASMPGEPDTWALIDELSARGVRVLLPVLRRRPDWAWYAGRDALTPSWHDIPEPTTPRLGADALGLASAIVVSGLIAAPSGLRVGGGGGWYDRALPRAAASARTFVLLGDDEVVDEVVGEGWDTPIDVIVTPGRTIVTEWGRERGVSFPG